MLHRVIPILVILLIGAGPAVAQRVVLAEEEPTLTFGLTRTYGPAATQQSVRLISAFLTQALGRRVRGVAYNDSDDLAAALAKGDLDFGWVSAAAYVRATKKAPVILIRKSKRRGMPYYRSVIFVRADSAIRRIGDLKGKRMAWGPHGSASANMVPRGMLLDQKLDLARLFGSQVELKDHAAVCNAVYTGEADAGASLSEERPDLGEPEVDGCLPVFQGKMDQFRILATSGPIPNDVFVGRSKVDTQLADKIGRALESLASGNEVLADGFRCDGFDTGNDREFDVLRRAIDHVPPTKK